MWIKNPRIPVLPWSVISGTRSRDLSVLRRAPYPLGHEGRYLGIVPEFSRFLISKYFLKVSIASCLKSHPLVSRASATDKWCFKFLQVIIASCLKSLKCLPFLSRRQPKIFVVIFWTSLKLSTASCLAVFLVLSCVRNYLRTLNL